MHFSQCACVSHSSREPRRLTERKVPITKIETNCPRIGARFHWQIGNAASFSLVCSRAGQQHARHLFANRDTGALCNWGSLWLTVRSNSNEQAVQQWLASKDKQPLKAGWSIRTFPDVQQEAKEFYDK